MAMLFCKTVSYKLLLLQSIRPGLNFIVTSEYEQSSINFYMAPISYGASKEQIRCWRLFEELIVTKVAKKFLLLKIP